MLSSEAQAWTRFHFTHECEDAITSTPAYRGFDSSLPWFLSGGNAGQGKSGFFQKQTRADTFNASPSTTLNNSANLVQSEELVPHSKERNFSRAKKLEHLRIRGSRYHFARSAILGATLFGLQHEQSSHKSAMSGLG